MKNNTFYITTPLYYPSGKWHLGHSYTTVCCDALARYKRMAAFDVCYLTGTDEHGQKIAERAAENGMSPKDYVDGLVGEIRRLWSALGISNDKFIRTTDDYHIKSVQKIFKDLYDKGDIYKSSYKGKYCTPCEAFWTSAQLKDGKCPDCGREVTDAEEECYFFRISKYADRLEQLLDKTDFVQPRFRAVEMLNNFIRPGLTDLAVSRTSVKWGIPVSFDPGHVVYVWIDALSNYINALGYNGDGATGTDNADMRYWPADLHMVGKEIVRFHVIVWPAILMALGLPLPKKVYGHGWLLLGGDKMSKSKGNVADPFTLIDRYGADAVRYYLLREIPFGADGVYSPEAFLNRVNSDLVNDLGNLVKRTVAMANQYFGGKVKRAAPDGDDQMIIRAKALAEAVAGLKGRIDAHIDELSCSKTLEEIFAVINRANKYIDESAPWVLFKQGNTSVLNAVLYNLLEAVRVCGTLLLPFIPDGAKRIFGMLNLACPSDFKGAEFGLIKEYSVGKDEILYVRLDVKKELAELDAIEQASFQGVKPGVKDAPRAEENKMHENKEAGNKRTESKEAVKSQTEPQEISLITADEFFKCNLKIAEVVAAEKVEKADKLLKITLDVAGQQRTVVSGIAQHYAPAQLIGRKVVLVANLKPAKLRGIESHGMLLCATGDDGSVVLISPEKDVKSGSVVS